PDYPWDDTQNSQMQFHYDAFMPKGIFWQLAVTLYRYIPNQDWVWRNGMIIQRGNTWAEIKENIPQRCVSLRFYGPSIPEFRAVIVDELDSISQSYHQLKYEKMIPCQCSECAGSNQPEFFDYAVVKKRQEKGKKDTIECRRSEEDVNLDLLLRGYEIQAILQTLPDKQNGDPAPPPPISNPKSIFISYRRTDSNPDTGRIYDRLVASFGETQVFKDTASIPLGVGLTEYINQSISQCQIVLAIIGKTWISATEKEDGTQRLANPKDFVRIELELALKRGITVVPVFLDGVSLPKPSQLPESLHPLLELNGIEIGHDPRFDADIERLVKDLKVKLGQDKNNY
ncbi:MAG: TIR domain-containing protein, partial [Phormidesmis sp.]